MTEPRRRRTQADRVLEHLLGGARATKWSIRGKLRIENVGRCIEELRERDIPIATIWLDKTTYQPIYSNGRLRAWFGVGRETEQPAGAVAAYQLCCRQCHTVDPEKLGWRPTLSQKRREYNLGEFAATYLCVRCTADLRCDHETSDVPSPARKAAQANLF